MEGFIYVISQKAEGLYKVGKTSTDKKSLLKCYSRGCPSPKIEFYSRCKNYEEVEKRILKIFEDKRTKNDHSGKLQEWIEAPLKDIIDIVSREVSESNDDIIIESATKHIQKRFSENYEPDSTLPEDEDGEYVCVLMRGTKERSIDNRSDSHYYILYGKVKITKLRVLDELVDWVMVDSEEDLEKLKMYMDQHIGQGSDGQDTLYKDLFQALGNEFFLSLEDKRSFLDGRCLKIYRDGDIFSFEPGTWDDILDELTSESIQEDSNEQDLPKLPERRRERFCSVFLDYSSGYVKSTIRKFFTGGTYLGNYSYKDISTNDIVNFIHEIESHKRGIPSNCYTNTEQSLIFFIEEGAPEGYKETWLGIIEIFDRRELRKRIYDLVVKNCRHPNNRKMKYLNRCEGGLHSEDEIFQIRMHMAEDVHPINFLRMVHWEGRKLDLLELEDLRQSFVIVLEGLLGQEESIISFSQY